MWTHAIEVAKQYKLPPGAVFHIVAAYHREEPRYHDQKMHDLLIELDEEYGTLPESPLHHDRRCPIHGTKFSNEPPAERGVNP